MKRQKTGDVPHQLVMAPAVEVHWLPAVPAKMIFDVQSDYCQFVGVVNDDAGLSSKFLAEVITDIEEYLFSSCSV